MPARQDLLSETCGVSEVAGGSIDSDLAAEWEDARRRMPFPRGEDHLEWLRRDVARNPTSRLWLAVVRDERGAFLGAISIVDERADVRWRLRLPSGTRNVRIPIHRSRITSERVVGSDDPEVAARLLREVLARRVDAEAVVIAGALVGSGLDQAALSTERASDGWLRLPSPRINTRFQIRMGDDFDRYLQDNHRSSFRTSLNRNHRRMLERPGAAFIQVRDADQVGPFLQEAGQIWAASWHGERAGRLDEHRLGEELRWWAARGQLRAYLLVDAEGPLAFEIARLVDGVLWLDRIAHRQDRPTQGPGKLTMVHAIREAHAEGARLVDMQYGDYPYKRDWANGRVDLRPIAFSRTRPRPVLAMGPQAVYGQLRAAGIEILQRRGLADRARRFSDRRLGR